MGKVLVKVKIFMVVAVSLGVLPMVSSCVESESSFQAGGEVAKIRRFFPGAVSITEMPISQDARIFGRPDEAIISEIKGASDLLGYRVDCKVVSRSGPFRIRVLLDKQLYVKQATVISYPWDRGRDVCKRAFTRQFEGKGPDDPIRLNKDIDAMTGATISSHVMAEGVRDIINLLKIVNEK